jgi:hypothetical protein
MKTILTLIILLVSVVLHGQPKVFELWFEDSAGNRDTLWFGYDPTATFGVDEHLGEVNLMGEPYDSTLFAFFTDALSDETTPSIEMTYPSNYIMKTQFVKDIYYPHEIGVIAKNWPVKISWQSADFKGQTEQYWQSEWAKYYSFIITSWHPPGGWFDAKGCGQWPTNLQYTNMEEVEEVEVMPEHFCRYINEISPDTIHVLHLASERTTNIKTIKKQLALIEFSLADQVITITGNSSYQVSIIDSWGRNVLNKNPSGFLENTINISTNELRKGIYVVIVTGYISKQQLAIKKITVL